MLVFIDFSLVDMVICDSGVLSLMSALMFILSFCPVLLYEILSSSVWHIYVLFLINFSMKSTLFENGIATPNCLCAPLHGILFFSLLLLVCDFLFGLNMLPVHNIPLGLLDTFKPILIGKLRPFTLRVITERF